MKKNLIVILILLSNLTYAQDVVNVFATGTGENSENALKSAFRDAIAQVAGVYIISETKIINDALKSDEIWEVSKGNIVKYDILFQSEKKVSIKAQVSLKKIDKYLQTKGASIDFDGLKFSFDINQLDLNKKGEMKVLNDLVEEIKNNINNCIDYEIKAESPIELGDMMFENYRTNRTYWIKGYALPFVVKAITNNNIKILYTKIFNTLEKLNMSESEITLSRKSNRPIFEYKINGAKDQQKFNLRSQFDGCFNSVENSIDFNVNFEGPDFKLKKDKLRYLRYNVVKNKFKEDCSLYLDDLRRTNYDCNFIVFPNKSKLLIRAWENKVENDQKSRNRYQEFCDIPYTMKFIKMIKRISIDKENFSIKSHLRDQPLPEKFMER